MRQQRSSIWHVQPQTVGWDAGITISNIQNVMGVLYSSSNYQGMFNLQNVLPVVGYERSVFYR